MRCGNVADADRWACARKVQGAYPCRDDRPYAARVSAPKDVIEDEI